MRASKLRFPDSTLAPMRSFFVSASSSSRSSGPELPMQVVQPNPTTLKPKRSRNGCSPVFVRYSLTTREPGASEVFTHGLTLSPRSTAFFASSPAASITAGFEVLVHEVMAAITTSPCVSSTVDGPRAAACSTRRAGSASAGCSSSRPRSACWCSSTRPSGTCLPTVRRRRGAALCPSAEPHRHATSDVGRRLAVAVGRW